MFGRKNIAEVQASEIKYAENYKEAVSISLTIYVLFGSVHTCYTFHTTFQVRKRKVLKEGKDPSRVLKENKGVSKKRPKRDEKSTDDSNKHDQFFRADIDR